MAKLVTTVCKRTVVSTKPVEPGKFMIPSALDRVMEHNHVRVVHYYDFPGRWDLGEVTKLLRESVSEMANSLPILTGRLVRDNDNRWIVKCNDAGIRMVESTAKGSLEEWLGCVDRDMELQLTHWEDMYHKPYFWSTTYIKVTEFEKGGVAIGLSGIHMLVDPISITSIIKAWAHTTLHHTSSYPSSIIQSRSPPKRSQNHKPSTDLINSYTSYFQNPPPPHQLLAKQATLTFKFSHQMVRTCISTVKNNGISKLSPFEALASIFWVAISKMRGNDRLLNMSICVDPKIGSKESLGNSMVYNKVRGTVTSGSGEDEMLGEARKVIEEAVDEVNRESVVELMEWLESRNGDVTSPASNVSCRDLICVNVEGRDPYGAEFQDGIGPVRVSCYIEPVVAGLGQVLVLPSPAGEGEMSRVVMVTLGEDEAVMLCKEELIVRLSPTVLMGP